MTCAKEYALRWSRDNRESTRESKRRSDAKRRDIKNERSRLHYAKNTDRILTAHREYRRTNAEKVRVSANISAQKYRDSNPDKVRESLQKYERQNPDKRNAKNARRKAMLLNAMPTWANVEAIRKIYARAVRKTRDTCTAWHVDHIVPLQSKFVCGLHCEANLQIIPGVENMKKGNRTWPDKA